LLAFVQSNIRILGAMFADVRRSGRILLGWHYKVKLSNHMRSEAIRRADGPEEAPSKGSPDYSDRPSFNNTFSPLMEGGKMGVRMVSMLSHSSNPWPASFMMNTKLSKTE
jgi:hypothetical protein